MSGTVVVIGGGVIGGCCAYELARAGFKVTVLDKGAFGKACSHGNCGLVSPSHVMPLCTKGMVRRVLPMLLSRDAPVSVKPRLDPRLWGFLWRFWRNCDEGATARIARGRHELLNLSRRRYDALLAETGMACEFEAKGCLFVYRTAHEFEEFGPFAEMSAREFGAPFERIGPEALTAMEPALKPGVAAGAWLFRDDAHLRPDRFMAGLKAAMVKLGVDVREEHEVTEVVRDGGRVTGVRTNRGEFACDACVLATGAWGGWGSRHERWAGCKVPVQPGKGYSLTMTRPARCPGLPLIFEEDRVAVTPFASGYRLGSIMEFAGYDTSLKARRLDLLRRVARRYLHEPEGPAVTEEWYGWRPMTPDDLPLIGRAPGAANLYLALGHNMVGLSSGPGTGVLVSEMVRGVKPSIDVGAYEPGRFGGKG